MHENIDLPKWVFSETQLKQDKEYFENLTRCIFQGGLSWAIIANKWPNFKKAFDEFDIEKVANYGIEDKKRLQNDVGIIRNRQKIMATIHNAREFKRIIVEHGSFKKWLDGLEKGNNYDYVVKRLRSQFKRIGTSTAYIFLWSIGEPIAWNEKLFKRKPSKIA